MGGVAVVVVAGAGGVLVAGLPLPGRQLAWMGLRVFASGEGPQVVRWVELVDLRAADGRTNWVAAGRNGGGFVVTDDGGGCRWFLTPKREIERVQVRLAGTDRVVDFGARGRGTGVEAGSREGAGEDVLEPVTDP